MKVIQVLQDIDLKIKSSQSKKLEHGKGYILSNALLQKLKNSVPAALGLETPFLEVYKEYTNEDLNNKSILMIRHGGGGDILFISTGIKELKRKFPKAEICVTIAEQYLNLIESELEISRIFNLPMELEEWNSFDYHITFEGLLEESELALQYNAYDLFMLKMGLDIKKVLPGNKIPQITLFDVEKDTVKKELPMLKNSAKKIGIQIESSAPIRNYPVYNLYEVAKQLIKKNYEVYIFGSFLQNQLITSLVKKLGPGSYNASSMNLRKSIILSSFMDFFIAPDSVFTHIAGALGIPLIGIYGPFLSESRMKYFKNSIGIDFEAGCSPCFHHSSFPCSKGNPSPCLASISPEIILEAFAVLETEVGGN